MTKRSYRPDRASLDLLLFDFARGALDGSHALFAEAWTLFDAEAGAEAVRHETLGGMVLCGSCVPAAMAADSLSRTLARLDSPPETAEDPPQLAVLLGRAGAGAALTRFDFGDHIIDVVAIEAGASFVLWPGRLAMIGAGALERGGRPLPRGRILPGTGRYRALEDTTCLILGQAPAWRRLSPWRRGR